MVQRVAEFCGRDSLPSNVIPGLKNEACRLCSLEVLSTEVDMEGGGIPVSIWGPRHLHIADGGSGEDDGAPETTPLHPFQNRTQSQQHEANGDNPKCIYHYKRNHDKLSDNRKSGQNNRYYPEVLCGCIEFHGSSSFGKQLVRST